LILLAVACLVFFQLNQVALFFGYDGVYTRQLTKFSHEWGLPFTTTALTPLSGLGDIKFGMNFWLSLPSVLSSLIHGSLPNPVWINTFTALELFCAIWFLAGSLEVTRGTKIAASWLGSVLTMPFIVPVMKGIGGFYAISGLIPYIIEQMAILAVILGLTVRLRVGQTRQNMWLGVAIIGLVYLLVYQFPTQFTLSAPILTACAIYSTLTLVRSKKQIPTFLKTAAVISALLASPALFILGMLVWSPPPHFHSELLNTDGGARSWVYVSILGHGPIKLGWANTVIYILAAVGAFNAVRKGQRLLKGMAILYLICASVIMFFGILVTFILDGYKGIHAIYFEWTLWPIMFVYACYCLRISGEYLMSADRKFRDHKVLRRLRDVGAATPTPVFVPLLLLGIVSILNRPRKASDLPKPPVHTALIDFFEKKNMAIHPGGSWEGSVANFSANKDVNTPIGWEDHLNYDLPMWRAVGNDHRGPGLWWYNIPSLFSYHQCMSPAYYYMVTRLFAKPEDKQTRNVVVLSKPNPKLLGLFGVRYFLTNQPADLKDAAISAGAFTWQQVPNQPIQQYIYEVKRPNLRGFSPTQAILQPTAAGSIAAMGAADFNPELQVVVHDKLDQALTAVQSSALVWQKEGPRISATSEGWSLLVLPLAFSRCLEIEPVAGKGDPVAGPFLVRVNVGLTGVLFQNKLDAIIQQQFGPYGNVLGRFADYKEFKHLVTSLQIP
jgi:hypothetical protein